MNSGNKIEPIFVISAFKLTLKLFKNIWKLLLLFKNCSKVPVFMKFRVHFRYPRQHLKFVKILKKICLCHPVPVPRRDPRNKVFRLTCFLIYFLHGGTFFLHFFLYMGWFRIFLPLNFSKKKKIGLRGWNSK